MAVIPAADTLEIEKRKRKKSVFRVITYTTFIATARLAVLSKNGEVVYPNANVWCPVRIRTLDAVQM
jgi:hypothetical protein